MVIKFRAWSKTFGKMMRVSAIEFSDDGIPLKIISPDFKGAKFSADDCILMQYSGVNDKDGREIFEGDIVDEIYYNDGFEQYNIVYPSVIFDEDGFGFMESDFESGIRENTKNRSIVGNIYENHEYQTSRKN